MKPDTRDEAIKALLGGYTRKELDDAFSSVADPDDWKARIDKIIYVPDADDPENKALDLIVFAVSFFTATEAIVTPVGNYRYRVTATGYRSGPAGP